MSLQTRNTYRCRICRDGVLDERVDFGCQPLGNRYRETEDTTQEERFSLRMGQCECCGTIQLLDLVPADTMRPRVDWITYREPERHLDQLVTQLVQHLNRPIETVRAGGISFKDESSLNRLKNRGAAGIWQLSLGPDLGISATCAGLETIQDRLTVERARHIAGRKGTVDVLFARHILEHCHDPGTFTKALSKLLRPGGLLVFEVPDCKQGLESGDYCLPWEEHVSYFTPFTFQAALEALGLDLVHFEIFPNPHENILTAITRCRGDTDHVRRNGRHVDEELDRGKRYGEAFASRRNIVRSYLSRFKSDVGPVAIFGAGHLASMFTNLMEVDEFLTVVIDDHEHKQGLFMPGSRCPIAGASALVEQSIQLCLLTLSPESEIEVLANNRAYAKTGGIFASIFPNQENGLQAFTEPGWH